MILYTIMPPEVVFGENQQDNDNNYIEIDYMGERVLVSALTNNSYVINRVISTKPKSYLNPGLQPGTVIKGSV